MTVSYPSLTETWLYSYEVDVSVSVEVQYSQGTRATVGKYRTLNPRHFSPSAKSTKVHYCVTISKVSPAAESVSSLLVTKYPQ